MRNKEGRNFLTIIIVEALSILFSTSRRSNEFPPEDGIDAHTPHSTGVTSHTDDDADADTKEFTGLW